MKIGDRIKAVRAEKGMSRPKLAELTKIPYPTLAGIENGDQDSSTQLDVIAQALGVRIEWLKTGKAPKTATGLTLNEEDWPDVMAYKTSASLGDGFQPDDWMETHKLKFRAESLGRKRLRAERLGVVYGRGDSMLPRIHDGDAILFDRSDTTPRDGHLYVITYGNDLLAKRLVNLGGRWFIESLNKDDPKWAKPQLVDEVKHFEIHGRVRWIGSWED